MTEYDRHDCDVLVIGAGGAGLRAAIEAANKGVSVGLVCKSLLGKAHTVMAEGGMAASLGNTDEGDNWKVHFRDTIRGGKMIGDWKMAQNLVQEAPERVLELERWGAVFDRTAEGLINQRPFGGHRYPRLAHVGDRTGLEMIRTLQDHCVHQNVQVHMECTITDLLVQDGKACGALGYWRETGKFVLFMAKAVILATGGAGKCYRITSNSWEGTGDGHALAYRAGAELVDMEFVQFHPTGMIWPPSVRGILVTEGVRGEGGVLKNSEGTRFMFNYIPEMFKAETAKSPEEASRWLAGDRNAGRPPELLTRDVVAKAIRAENLAGRGSPHGGAFLDIASQRKAEYIKRKLPSMHHQFMQLAQLDITTTPMEVGPTCHYIMGGVRVNGDTTASSIPGLYAAGEVAGGIHGANRLGGNSLVDLLVFGQRAGVASAEFVRAQKAHETPDDQAIQTMIGTALKPFENEGTENPYSIMQTLQTSMEEHAGIVRDGNRLQAGLEVLKQLRERTDKVTVEGNLQYNPGWHYALDLRNLIDVSEAIALSALHRTESRGGHTREDYPETDVALEPVNTVVSKGKQQQMEWRHQKRVPMPAELAALLD